MKTILIAAAALIAIPAAAAQAGNDTAAAGAGTAAAASAAAPAVVDKKSYCMFEDVTSSRLPRKVCKSRAAWLAQGVEITRTR